MIRFVDVPAPKPAPGQRLIAAAKEMRATVAAAPKAERLAAARKAIAETKPETKPAKGGRPRKHDGEPWKAEGLSRAAWYRKNKS